MNPTYLERKGNAFPVTIIVPTHILRFDPNSQFNPSLSHNNASELKPEGFPGHMATLNQLSDLHSPMASRQFDLAHTDTLPPVTPKPKRGKAKAKPEPFNPANYRVSLANVDQARQKIMERRLVGDTVSRGPEDDRRMREWVQKLMNAMININDIKDGEKNNGNPSTAVARISNGYYDPEAVELACWELLASFDLRFLKFYLTLL